MRRLRLTAFAGIWSVVALAACDDPFALEATFSNYSDTLSVFALTGTPAAYPSALALASAEIVRADGNFAYDIAFDLDPSGKVILLPVRLVGGAYVTGKAVGIQKSTVHYDSIGKASQSGYTFDTATVVSPGQAVTIQVNEPSRCQFQFSPFLYTKLVVDSVNAPLRTIYFHFLTDPNCGFRGLGTGRPKD